MSEFENDSDDDLQVVPTDQQESEDDVRARRESLAQAVLFNTDWTVETICLQIEKGNIKLDPPFQRRDAWDQNRKSKLIESIVCGFPVPNIVLAEDLSSKGRYLVIDGKQRLSSLSNFRKDSFDLKGLSIREDLNNKKFSNLQAEFPDDANGFDNQPIRTVVIRNWPDEDYLYTVFYRLNSGSMPLSPQELRRALHGGRLLDRIDEYIVGSNSFKSIFGDKLDRRMRDAELVLRFIAFEEGYPQYDGDLKKFLDNVVKTYDTNWDNQLLKVNLIFQKFDGALDLSREIFGADAFKKWNREKDEFEKRINRAIFDVVVRYFSDPNLRTPAINGRTQILEDFKKICAEDNEFKNAIERTTKTPAAYAARYRIWGEALGSALGRKLDAVNMRLI